MLDNADGLLFIILLAFYGICLFLSKHINCSYQGLLYLLLLLLMLGPDLCGGTLLCPQTPK